MTRFRRSARQRTGLHRSLATLLLVVVGVAAASASAEPASGQELTGVAIGPDGQPLAEQVVVLHRVGGGSGAFVSTDTTSPEGGFRFALPVQDTAVYFAALRYDGRMYIGPAAEAGGEPVSDYILRVDPSTEAGAVASALSGQAPPPPPARPGARPAGGGSDTGAFLLVGVLALTSAAIFFFAAPRYRRQRTRDTLIELARVENELAVADPEDRARLKAERDRHRERLAPPS